MSTVVAPAVMLLSTTAGESDPATLVGPYGQNLMSLVALLRQFRTAAA